MKNDLSVVFLSNYFNHHQKPLSDALFALLGGSYHFVETSYMAKSRRELGYGGIEYPSYVIRPDKAFTEATQALIDNADVVIAGSAPEKLLKTRIRKNRLVFRYSERPFKQKPDWKKFLPRLILWNLRSPFWKPIYMLCASAYTASDYAKFGMFLNRCYKWGYFPKAYQYENLEQLLQNKQPASLVWAARYLDWKHPEIAIELGRRLKQDGYNFTISMIGNGALLNQTIATVVREGLENEIHVLGAMSPEEVREHMEQAQIHIFTSDRNEGWGAVLNESMNSGCVPVANRAIGSAPYLIEDGKNGFLYDTVDELYERVKFLLDHPEERTQMAQAAYRTIVDEWNAENAAKQFIALASQLLDGKKKPTVPEKGVCSSAK